MKLAKPMIQMRNYFLLAKVENLIHKTRINIIPDFINGKKITELITVLMN